MAVVAGVDFGTLSVRVSIVDSERGLLASAIAEYPLHRKREDPEHATQSHEDHMRALAAATREAVRKSGVLADQIPRLSENPEFSQIKSWLSLWIRPVPPLFPSEKISSRSMTIICGAIIAPRPRLPKSRRLRIAKSLRPSIGAAVFILRSGVSRNSCTGSGIIPPSDLNSCPPSSTATWSPQPFAASPRQRK